MQSPVVVWRFTDGQPGHDNQSLGLVTALKNLLPVEDYTFRDAAPGFKPLSLLFGRFPNRQKYPPPDLLTGAGHSTHWPMLRARRAKGGRVVVLMKPSLPVSWFDAVIAPRHDLLEPADHILLTEGALNPVSPEGEHRPERGLIMLGGVSDEYDWQQSTSVFDQLRTLIRERPNMQWTLTSSRRTPATIMERASQLDNINLVPFSFCQPGWMEQQLALCGEVWVTEDSVSMLYEALSCGARVGVIKVPRTRPGRVAAGIDRLIEEDRIPLPGSFQLTRPDAEPLQEARRCALWVQQRWLNR